MDSGLLRVTLSRADDLIALNAEAVRLASFSRAQTSPEGKTSPMLPAVGQHPMFGDSQSRFHVLVPGALTWPVGFYATIDLAGYPQLNDVAQQFVQATAIIPQLRASAARASTGFLSRLFSRTDPIAEADAQRLEQLVWDPSITGPEAQVKQLLAVSNQAMSLQSRGVAMLPTIGVDETKLLEARSRAAVALDITQPFFDYIDPNGLLATWDVVRAAVQDANSEPRLRREAEEHLDSLAHEHAHTIVDGLELEALKSVTAQRLRFGDLASIGVNTVGDVLGADVAKLSRAQGVGEQTATRMLAAAQALLTEARDSFAPAIGSQRTPAAVALTRVLHRYGQVSDVDDVQRERKERVLDYFSALPIPTAGAAPWPIIGEGDAAWKLFQEDVSWVHTSPELFQPRAVADVGEAAWDDYLANPARYQTLLARLLRLDAEGSDDNLDASIVEKVRALQLDTSLIKDLYLRGYQSYGARFAVVQKKIILGDEMGLGKTVQAISMVAHVMATEPKLHRAVVVCPASVVENWMREIAKFSSIPAYKAHGDLKDASIAQWTSAGGILVCTYEGARSMDLNKPQIVIVDEAHFAKNPRAKRSMAVEELVTDSVYAMLMSGTPLENRVDEFIVLVGYVQPELAKGTDSMSADKFRKHIAPAYLRRNQQQVLDELPQRLDHLDWIELGEPEKQIYTEAVRQGNFMLMRRAATLTPENPTVLPTKIERIVELVDKASEADRKVLIFSFFLESLAAIQAALGERVVGLIDGSVAPASRQGLVDKLGESGPGSVLLAQINAGGQGINIQTASVVIIVEPQVKPTLEDQAIARSFRMGQTQSVVVYRLAGADTVDEKMLEMLGRKREIFREFAKDSESASAVDAVDVSEAQLARDIIAAERERLGLPAEQ